MRPQEEIQIFRKSAELLRLFSRYLQHLRHYPRPVVLHTCTSSRQKKNVTEKKGWGRRWDAVQAQREKRVGEWPNFQKKRVQKRKREQTYHISVWRVSHLYEQKVNVLFGKCVSWNKTGESVLWSRHDTRTGFCFRRQNFRFLSSGRFQFRLLILKNPLLEGRDRITAISIEMVLKQAADESDSTALFDTFIAW